MSSKLPLRLRQHTEQQVTSVNTLFQLKLTNGRLYGYTDATEDIVYDANDGNGFIRYLAETGYTRSAVSSEVSLDVDSLEVEGYVDMIDITENLIRAGELDYAQVAIMMINRNDLTAGHMVLRRGRIGEITKKGEIFSTEIRGLSQNLNQSFIEKYSPGCRVDLGSTRCGVNLTPFTFTGYVSNVDVDKLAFHVILDTPQADGYFDFGIIEFTTGNNVRTGISTKEIRTHIGNFLVLVEKLSYSIQKGDQFRIIAGCDKLFATCGDKFNNKINFQGEPHVPGIDKIMETPDAPE